MSLINDALKRAKSAQQNAPAPPILGPPFVAVTSEQSQSKRRFLPGVAAVAIGVLFAGLLVAQWFQRNDEPMRVRARTQPRVEVRAAETPAAAAVSQPAKLVPAPIPAAPAVPEKAVAAALPAPAHSAEPVSSPVPPPVIASAPPEPRLQAIIYSPARPSAIINGKTLFLGDPFGDARLTAVTVDSVTLTDRGKVKVLTLSQ